MSDLSVLLHVLTDIPLQVGVETFLTFILQIHVFLSQPIICNIQTFSNKTNSLKEKFIKFKNININARYWTR